MVERLYQRLMMDVFPGAIRNDATPCEAINAFAGNIEFRSEELHFTLPALFDFLIAQTPDWPVQDEAARHRDYLRFRNCIYHNPTNETLGQQGAAVEIALLNEDHELTVYRLVRTHNQK